MPTLKFKPHVKRKTTKPVAPTFASVWATNLDLSSIKQQDPGASHNPQPRALRLPPSLGQESRLAPTHEKYQSNPSHTASVSSQPSNESNIYRTIKITPGHTRTARKDYSHEIFQDTCLTAAKGLHIHVYPIAAPWRRYYANINIHHMGCDLHASLHEFEFSARNGWDERFTRTAVLMCTQTRSSDPRGSERLDSGAIALGPLTSLSPCLYLCVDLGINEWHGTCGAHP